MPLVVGVTFRKVGKVYYFDPGDLEIKEGDFVIAETARGIEFGEVMLAPREVPEEELVAALKRVVRVATNEDIDREVSNRDREKHAFEVCEKKIIEHGLPMKLLEAEYAFDGSQVTFSFCADGRIDFRELVKDVAGVLRTKVQLHQIGVRDEAKLIGGYGTCGRPLCCATFLSNFDPISMKMAKDQSLFLNPAKFSGACGKLMCCLRYEHEHYKQAQKILPSVGAVIPLEKGTGRVVDVNVISNVITLQTEDEVIVHIPAEQLHLEGLCRRHGAGCDMADRHCECLQPLDGSCASFSKKADEVDSEDINEDTEDSGGALVEEDVVPPLVEEDEIVASKVIAGVKWREPKSAQHTDDANDKADTESDDKQNTGNGGSRMRYSNGRRRHRPRPHGNRPQQRGNHNKENESPKDSQS